MQIRYEFRGLPVKGDWVYGSLVETTHGIKHMPHQHTKFWIVTTAFGNGGWFNINKRTYVKPNTVGQFIEAFDMDGTKVFEGDILSHESVINCVFICIRNGTKFTFKESNSEYNYSMNPAEVANYCRVIGNTTQGVFDEQ